MKTETVALIPTLDIQPIIARETLPVPVDAGSNMVRDVVQLRRNVMQRAQKAGDDTRSWIVRKSGTVAGWLGWGAAASGVTAGIAACVRAAHTPFVWANAGNMKCNNDVSDVSFLAESLEHAARGEAISVWTGSTNFTDGLEYARAMCEVPTASDAFWQSGAATVMHVGMEAGLAAAAIAGGLVAIRAVKKRVNAKRALPASAVEPLRIGFVGAEHDGTKREVVRLLAADVFADLKKRGVRGPVARESVASIVDDQSGVTEDEARQAEAVRYVLGRVFDVHGDALPLNHNNAGQIMTKIRELTADESALLRPQLRDVLFTADGCYRGKSIRAAELELLDFLMGIDPRVKREPVSD